MRFGLGMALAGEGNRYLCRRCKAPRLAAPGTPVSVAVRLIRCIVLPIEENSRAAVLGHGWRGLKWDRGRAQPRETIKRPSEAAVYALPVPPGPGRSSNGR